MSIITISRGSYSHGKELAERVAKKLGYECIAGEVLSEASEQFHVPEIKLLRAIHDAPSILDRFTFGKETYIAYFQAALLEHFQKDNVVYHGLAGHFFVKNVSHVLKVRIIAEMEDRINLVMEREGLTKDQALKQVKCVDDTRRKWSLQLYEIDTNDPHLYDLVIHIKKISSYDGADIVCHASGLDRFQTPAQSQQAMDDLLLAARVKASLIERRPRVNVTARQGVVYISLEGGTSREAKEMRDAARQVPGVKKIDVNLYPFVTPD